MLIFIPCIEEYNIMGIYKLPKKVRKETLVKKGENSEKIKF